MLQVLVNQPVDRFLLFRIRLTVISLLGHHEVQN